MVREADQPPGGCWARPLPADCEMVGASLLLLLLAGAELAVAASESGGGGGGFEPRCSSESDYGWPRFHSRVELEADAKWTKYFLALYGELPSGTLCASSTSGT